MRKRKSDWVIAIVASIIAFALSWPFWRDFGYWAESPGMWWVYFTFGFLIAIYVFYVFIACTRMLFLHDSLIKSGKIKPSASLEPEREQEDQP